MSYQRTATGQDLALFDMAYIFVCFSLHYFYLSMIMYLFKKINIFFISQMACKQFKTFLDYALVSKARRVAKITQFVTLKTV